MFPTPRIFEDAGIYSKTHLVSAFSSLFLLFL
jgi:hypothetical protein